MKDSIVKMTGIEMGNVVGDLKVLAARSFLHLLVAICGDHLKCVLCVEPCVCVWAGEVMGGKERGAYMCLGV